MNMNIPPAIGELWKSQGGVYAGVIRGEIGKLDYHLIIPTQWSLVNKISAYGGYDIDEPKAASRFDGLANTRYLINSAQGNHPAARLCAGLVLDSHNDFYLPSINELALCMANVPDLFEKKWHLSSSQLSATHALALSFDGGSQIGLDKFLELQVRPVRKYTLDYLFSEKIQGAKLV